MKGRSNCLGSWRALCGPYWRGGCLRAPCATSCFVGEPFALRSFQRDGSARYVINAKRLAMRVSMAELGQVPLQVGLANTVIDAREAAFQDREEALHGVGVNVAPHVFPFGVPNRATPVGIRTEIEAMPFVGIEGAPALNIARHDLSHVIGGHMRHMEGADLTAALYQREYGRLGSAASRASEALVAVFILLSTADIRLIHFDSLAFAAHWIRTVAVHHLADTVPHEPCGFHGAIQQPLNLARREAFFAGAHQVNDLQPKMQRYVRTLEDRSLPHREGLAAKRLVALVEAGARRLALQLTNLLLIAIAAVRAYRTSRPKVRFHERESGFFVLEMRG